MGEKEEGFMSDIFKIKSGGSIKLRVFYSDKDLETLTNSAVKGRFKFKAVYLFSYTLLIEPCHFQHFVLFSLINIFDTDHFFWNFLMSSGKDIA